MGTPLTDAVNAYLEAGRSRLHMPGHKGRTVFPVGEAAAYDITEVEGADSLYDTGGPIAELEQAYSGLYGSAGSFISAGGSTLCIQAMLALAARPGQTVIAGRQLHTSAVNAMALLDLRPAWVYPGYCRELDGAGAVTAEDIAPVLQAHPQAAAVYITSPDYFGNMADIPAVSALCRKAGIPLLVDNAHGAHLIGLPGAPHPIRQGADLCCDSLHKSLPVLTGGAALHIADPRYLPDVKRRMALFGSTSPSYLIMLSVDQAIDYIGSRLAEDLERVSPKVEKLRRQAKAAGFGISGGRADPLRLSLGFWKLGYTRAEFGAHLRAHGMEPELVTGSAAVLMFSGFNGDEDFRRTASCIAGAERIRPPQRREFSMHRPEADLTPREAALAGGGDAEVLDAVGQIAGSMAAPCPPGIPLVVPGERIDEILAEQLKNAGIFRINVVKL